MRRSDVLSSPVYEVPDSRGHDMKLCQFAGLITLITSMIISLRRQNRLTFVIRTVATQFPTLDIWISLFWFAEEYNRAKVTRDANDEYKLFTYVYVFRYATAS